MINSQVATGTAPTEVEVVTVMEAVAMVVVVEVQMISEVVAVNLEVVEEVALEGEGEALMVALVTQP